MFQTFKQVEMYLKNRQQYGIKIGMDRIERLVKLLQRPDKAVPIIHVAGTNGKGSTIHFLQAALRASGYTIGVFTSPSMTTVCGHFLLDGVQIGKEALLEQMNEIYPAITILDEDNNHPTEFEILTAVAFHYFRNRVDFLLLETGMGGREDTTNIITPLLSVITSISMDHVAFLGETLGEIAEHKAGIIKYRRPVVVGNIEEPALSIVKKKAQEEQAQCYLYGKDFFIKRVAGNKLSFTLKKKRPHVFTFHPEGTHQQENIALAFVALTLIERKNYAISWRDVFKGIANITLPGRFERLSEEPLIIVDSAHNVASINRLIETIKANYPTDKINVLFSSYEDKDWSTMIATLKSTFEHLTVTTFHGDRAMSRQTLEEIEQSLHVRVTTDWKDYLTNLLVTENTETIYLVTGSFRFMTLVRNYVQAKQSTM